MPLIGIDAAMPEALLVMSAKGFGVVGVTDDAGALVGVVTDGDLRRNMDGLLARKVADVMTPRPRTISTAALASEALGIMNARQDHHALRDRARGAGQAGGDPARARLPARRRRLTPWRGRGSIRGSSRS